MAVPLVTDAQGSIRVHGTRVTLDSLITAFRAGSTAEEIAQQFPAVALADIYAIIAHYLHHPVDIDAYLYRRNAEAEAVEREIESRFDPVGLRARLLTRRSST